MRNYVKNETEAALTVAGCIYMTVGGIEKWVVEQVLEPSRKVLFLKPSGIISLVEFITGIKVFDLW